MVIFVPLKMSGYAGGLVKKGGAGGNKLRERDGWRVGAPSFIALRLRFVLQFFNPVKSGVSDVMKVYGGGTLKCSVLHGMVCFRFRGLHTVILRSPEY